MTSIAPNNELQLGISNKQILKIALPITLAMIIPQLNFVANTVFLSGLGEIELGSAGITGVYYLVFALVGSGLNSGLQALIARRAGQNRPTEIGGLFGQSIWIALVFAATGILITYLAAPLFLEKVLRNPAVIDQSSNFLKIRIWGLPFLYLFQMGNALLVGTNNSRYLKYGFIAEAILNIFLDYALIHGKAGLPAIGFNGAAYASVIAEFTGMAIVFSLLFGKKFFRRFPVGRLGFNKDIFGLIFRQSSPLVMQFVLSVGAWLLFYVLIENSGSAADRQERPLAISQTMRNFFAVFGIFSWSFASTSNAMVSNIIGQGMKDKVLHLVQKIARLSIAFSGTLFLILNLFPEFFLSIYGRDPGFIQEAVPVLRTVSFALLLMSMATVWLNAVTATGNTKVNLGIEIIAIILYSFYVLFVIRIWKLSLAWAWTSEFLYWIVLLGLSYLYMRSGKWRSKEI